MYKENLKKYIKSHAYIQLANIFFLFTAFLINIYLSKGGVSSEGFGVYNLMTTILASLTTIFTAGFPFYATRKISKEKITTEDFIGIAGLDFILCIGFIIVFIALSPVLGNLLFTNNSLYIYLIIVALCLPSYLFSGFILAFVNGKQEFKRQAIFLIISHSIKLIAVLVLSAAFGPIGAILGYGVPGLSLLIIVILAFRKKSEVKLARVITSLKKYSKNKNLWMYVIPLTIFAFINTAILSKDLLIIENLGTAKDLTNYSIITLIGRVPVYIFQALGTVIFPMYAVLETKKELKKEFTKDLLMQIGLGVGVVIGYLIFGAFILKVLYGEDFANNYFPALMITVISGISFSMFGLICVKFQAINKQFITLIAVVGSFLIINFFGGKLLTTYGLNGASANLLIATLPVYIVIVIYLFIYLSSKKSTNL